MKLEIVERRGVHVVRIGEARLTYPVLSGFFERMRQLIEGGVSRLMLDFGAVAYVDSAAIGCLMDVYRLLNERKGTLCVFGLTARVATMLSMTGVDRVVSVHETADDALNAFGQGASGSDADASTNGE
jgi:anti-anti-sigma factor